ncbi:MAG: glycosyltransferase [Candidatus Peribacteraceae bacterium]|jgi:dolichol-phosphate mannosyltransferase|nr:glycosyltransferase [Candidatus Peribacteraceae bacterium]MDP7454246.1 glycosyltransferase [Candidatus Peribacteraceae bacterium]MDP7645838.1 glycosyltransferase [Candidatus Peribacteraceae bacterium]|tara:strand:+ start:254 stop:1345 length:1092 start_codon:yes stop_codon:yes gene_type:complete
MLSIVLPTYNEAENIPVLIPKLREVLRDIPHEIIIVDDNSPDETWRIGMEVSKDMEDVHVIRRVDKRGLSSAVIDGFLSAKGDVLAVMDADGQHDMDLLPKLYQAVEANKGFAVGSRYIEGGSVGEWDERRQLISRVATKMALALCKVKVKDPMSGFFALDRAVFEGALEKLNPKGFKILLDLLVHAPKGTSAVEIPFTFSTRLHGESKLSWKVQLDFLEYLYDVTIGRFIPLTFVKFCMVGTLGVGVHMAAYLSLARLLGGGEELNVAGFSLAVIGATEVAIIFNFSLNNLWTFANQKLKGLGAIKGFGKYNVACILGAIANWAVSTFLFSRGWVELLAVFIGAITGVLWNYSMNRMITWRK